MRRRGLFGESAVIRQKASSFAFFAFFAFFAASRETNLLPKFAPDCECTLRNRLRGSPQKTALRPPFAVFRVTPIRLYIATFSDHTHDVQIFCCPPTY